MVNLTALDLNLLMALESLLDEASVGRAAMRVSLSQPAMSHALSRLRVVFGDPLLVRVGTRMQLTARAEALRYPVKDVLARVRDLLLSSTFEPASSTRSFQVFMADNAADLLLPLLLRRLQEEAPGVSIRTQSTGRGTLDAVQLARTVDVAISCVPNSFKGFYQKRLFTDRDALAVRRGHPLSRRMEGLEAFLQAKHVAVVGYEFSEDPVDTWLRLVGHQRNLALRVPHYLQALHMVAQSDLVAVIPERLICANAGVLNLEVLEVPLDVGTFEEYLLHPATSHADPGCVWLRQVFNDIAKSLRPLRPRRIDKIANQRHNRVSLHGRQDHKVTPEAAPSARRGRRGITPEDVS